MKIVKCQKCKHALGAHSNANGCGTCNQVGEDRGCGKVETVTEAGPYV